VARCWHGPMRRLAVAGLAACVLTAGAGATLIAVVAVTSIAPEGAAAAGSCGPFKYVTAPGYKVTPIVTGLPDVSLPTIAGVFVDGCIGASGLAFGPGGSLFVTDTANGGLYRFPPSGGVALPTREILHPLLGSPLEEIVTGRNGDLYVSRFATASNAFDGGIAEINPASGRLIRQVATGLTCPTSLAIDPLSGDLFATSNCYGSVASSDLWRIHDPAGPHPTTSVYLTLPSPTNYGMTFTPSGTMYLQTNSGLLEIGGTNTVTGTEQPHVTKLKVPEVGTPFDLTVVDSNGKPGTSLLLTYSGLGVAEVDLRTTPPKLTRLVSGFTYTGAILGPDGCVYLTAAGNVMRLSRTNGSCLFGSSEVSTIASSLISPAKALSPLRSVGGGLAVTAGLGVLLTFPSSLFNKTYEENSADLREWWQRRLRPFEDMRRRTRKRAPTALRRAAKKLSGLSETQKFAGVVVLGALLGSFNDPTFGFGVRSLLTFLGVLLAILVGVSIPALVAELYHRRRFGASERRPHALPSGLVIAAGCVVFSRAIGFEPGYLYGVVAGVLYTKELAKHEKVQLAALTSITILVIATAAWFAWSPVNGVADKPGAFLGIVLLDNLLASLFVSGIVGTVVGMMPLRALPGYEIKQWHRGVWAATFGLALFLVTQVTLRPDTRPNGPSHTPLAVTVVLFVAFGAISIVFHEHFEHKRRRLSGEAAPPLLDRIRAYFPKPVGLATVAKDGEAPSETASPEPVGATSATATPTNPEAPRTPR
jgi:hypothetical protein